MDRNNDVVRFPWPLALSVVVIVAFIAAIACFILFERREDIDLNSGRLRFQTTVGSIILSEHIQDSTFSDSICDSNLKSISPVWGHVNSEGVLGVHGRFGYALSELKRFIIVCDELHIDPDRRCVLGHKLLELMRHEQFPEMEKLIDELRESPVGEGGAVSAKSSAIRSLLRQG